MKVSRRLTALKRREVDVRTGKQKEMKEGELWLSGARAGFKSKEFICA